jgi:hypothetical protein
MTSLRFDIVVFNFRRLELFTNNFDRIRNFDRLRDRVTIVSASPSPAEADHIERFEEQQRLKVRYLTRHNRGYAELARAEYFTGVVGSLEQNLSHEYLFQMQDHYLDTESAASRYSPEVGERLRRATGNLEYDFSVKEDVVPDDAVFDLSKIEHLAHAYDVKAFFYDRANPCFFSFGEERFVSPCGANFVIRSRDVDDETVQKACRDLIRSCDGTYDWSLYAESVWGMTFFQEGGRYYDLKRNRLFRTWNRDDFYLAAVDYAGLKRFYERPAPIRALIRAYRQPRWAASTVLRRALPAKAYRGLRDAYRDLSCTGRRARKRGSSRDRTASR